MAVDPTKIAEIVEFIADGVKAFVELIRRALGGDDEAARRVGEILDPIGKNKLEKLRGEALQDQYYGGDREEGG